VTKKRFFEELAKHLEPAAIESVHRHYGHYRFALLLTRCNGLFGEMIYRTSCKDNIVKAEGKFNRWLAEYKKA